MNLAHPLFSLIMLVFVVALTGAYLLAVGRQWARGRRWPWLRVVCWLCGSFSLAISLAPGVMHAAHLDLRWHMAQHILTGMLAPLLLVLTAPVTALLLSIGGMYLLYATPLYAVGLQSVAVHHLVHIHFILAGYLFCQAVLGGPDKVARVAGAKMRLGILLVAIAAHSILSKLMYGYLWPVAVDYSAAQIQAAAQLMYYAGALIEIMLLGLLLLGGRLTRTQPLPLVRV